MALDRIPMIIREYHIDSPRIFHSPKPYFGPVSYNTSDAADEGLGVDLGGRRIIKKKRITVKNLGMCKVVEDSHRM